MESIYGCWSKGVDQQSNKQYDLAEKTYKSEQLTSKTNFNLGILYMSKNEWNKAIEAFVSAITCDKFLALAYFQKGVCELLLKKYDLSIQSWTSAVDILKHNEMIDYGGLHLDYILCKSEIYVNIALANYYKGNAQETESFLEKANSCKNIKDDVDDLKKKMEQNQSIYPCSVDNTAIFHPPRLPPELQKAIKEAQNGQTTGKIPTPSVKKVNTNVPTQRLVPSRPAPTLPPSEVKNPPPPRFLSPPRKQGIQNEPSQNERTFPIPKKSVPKEMPIPPKKPIIYNLKQGIDVNSKPPPLPMKQVSENSLSIPGNDVNSQPPPLPMKQVNENTLFIPGNDVYSKPPPLPTKQVRDRKSVV